MLLTQRVILVAAIATGTLQLAAPAQLAAQSCENSTVDALGEQTAKVSRAFLAELQAAVHANDKQKIAGMISYPLNVNHGTNRTRVRSKDALLAQYDTIFTEQIRKDILAQSSKCLFGNDNGSMVGNGDLWFSEVNNGPVKIYAVNITTTAGTSH